MDKKRTVDFTNIREYSLDPETDDDVYVFFSLDSRYTSLPEVDKDQLFFLNKEANNFLHHFFGLSFSDCDSLEWTVGFPYVGNSFKKDEFKHRHKGLPLKKWLYKRGVPFSKWVYVMQGYSTKFPMLMTWKMVIKYSEILFEGDDFYIFDESTQWCLKYHHDEYMCYHELPFKIPEIGYEELEKMNEHKKKYPRYKHPYLDE